MKKLFTSESVTCGHPDKMCDQISDAILDAYVKGDPNSRVACEVCVSKNIVLVVGEITSNATVDIDSVVRGVITDIGYDKDELQFNGHSCEIIKSLSGQSEDIALGVDKALEEKSNLSSKDLGAGDQGLMFGYACDETSSYMPLAIYLAHELAKRLEHVRKTNVLQYLRPDGKTQVTVEYDGNVAKRIDTIVVSCQHDADVKVDQIKEDIITHVINKIVSSDLIDEETKILVNPTGKFIIGGPAGDSGLTGRKIIVDTYGGYGHHGGGAFSGKDCTKVDRTASYYARYVAKNIVAAGLANKCEIQVAYAIGVATPVSIFINTFNTANIPESQILKIVETLFDFRPSAMIDSLGLRNPIYKPYATYGHFGREDLDTSWERLDKVEQINKMVETTKA